MAAFDAPGASRSADAGSLSVVVPTFNEAGNVAELVRRLAVVSDDADIREVIFVDDSTDETPEVIDAVATTSELPIRLIHREVEARVGGLSGAVRDGIAASRATWVLVMDADLQHPPEDVVRLMAEAQRPEGRDLVAASRYLAGGSNAGLSGGVRRMVSSGAIVLARSLFPRRLHGVTDTMTGFFVVRRAAVDLAALRPRGFKVLLEILGRNDLRVAEVPFRFASRLSGESKASVGQGMAYLGQLLRLRVDTALEALAPWLSRRAVTFGAIGAAVMALDVALFNLLLLTGSRPVLDKAISSGVAILASYSLNRRWTWRDRPSRGTGRELVTFALLSIAAAAIAETCLVISHDGLGLQTTVDDNLAANGIGLVLGTAFRFWSYNRWAFPAARPRTRQVPPSALCPVTGAPLTPVESA